MSQRDGFAGAFFLGTIVGGVVGGVVGALLTARHINTPEEEEENGSGVKLESKSAKKRRLFRASEGNDMETARRSLEDKIAQLNDAIDDVRHQLGGVHEEAYKSSEEAANRNPRQSN